MAAPSGDSLDLSVSGVAIKGEAPAPALPAGVGGEAARELRRYLMKPMRVTLKDGRVLVGKFRCLDASQNIVLRDAVRYVDPDTEWNETPQQKRQRRIGMVIVPRSALVRVDGPELEPATDSAPPAPAVDVGLD